MGRSPFHRTGSNGGSLSVGRKSPLIGNNSHSSTPSLLDTDNHHKNDQFSAPHRSSALRNAMENFNNAKQNSSATTGSSLFTPPPLIQSEGLPSQKRGPLLKRVSTSNMQITAFDIPSIQIDIAKEVPKAQGLSEIINTVTTTPPTVDTNETMRGIDLTKSPKSARSLVGNGGFVLKRRESVFNPAGVEKTPTSSTPKLEYVVPSLQNHYPQTVNDLYIKTMQEKNHRVIGNNAGNDSKKSKPRPQTAGATYSRRNNPAVHDEDDDEHVLNSARVNITSADLIVDTGVPSKTSSKNKKNKKENPADNINLLGIPGFIHPPIGEDAVPYGTYKNDKQANAEHLILRHSTELLNSESLEGQVTSDYYQKLEQELWKFEHVSRGKNKAMMVTHGNNVKLFNRGEPVEEFYNKYLLYQKDLIEKNEDFETMKQTMKKIRQRAKSTGSPMKSKIESENQSEKHVVFKRQTEEQPFNKENAKENNLWERKKKKRLKPISQFVQEQVSNSLTQEHNGGTFITEVQTNNEKPLTTKSSVISIAIPLSARSITSSIGPGGGGGGGYDLFITDEQVDIAERNKKTKLGLIDTIKRASGAQDKKKGDYVTGVNHAAQSGIGGIVAKFPSEELGESEERLKRVKAKEIPLQSNHGYHTIVDIEDCEVDYQTADLERVFPPIKIATFVANVPEKSSNNLTPLTPGSGTNSSNSSTASLHNLINNQSISVNNSASFVSTSMSHTNMFASNVDHIIDSIRSRIQYKNISNINVDELNSAALNKQLIDEEHEQMLDEKLQQFEGEFKSIMSEVNKFSHSVTPGFDPNGDGPHGSNFLIKKGAVDINGETFYKTKDLSPRKVDALKKKKEAKTVTFRKTSSGQWRRDFISTQTKLQYDLLVKLDDRSENRNVVAGSNEHLTKVSKKVMKSSEKLALYKVGNHKKTRTQESLWDKSKGKLDMQTTKFYQTILFYKRLTVFLEVIQAPSSANKLLIGFLNRLRFKLIKNPTLKHTKESLFFSLILQVIEDSNTIEGPIVLSDMNDKNQDEAPIDLFFSNRETIKVIQFLNAELSIKHDDLFSFLGKLPIKQNKLLLELKAKMKQKEEEGLSSKANIALSKSTGSPTIPPIINSNPSNNSNQFPLLSSNPQTNTTYPKMSEHHQQVKVPHHPTNQDSSRIASEKVNNNSIHNPNTQIQEREYNYSVQANTYPLQDNAQHLPKDTEPSNRCLQPTELDKSLLNQNSTNKEEKRAKTNRTRISISELL
ncbi:predicted protein [Naegleria gruberi]|uniref:Predicted protein n=1 Tax=Naegleria gruberi TaxID=5762 RepID=D2V559_NAEGR|nr:uncharacterized protein NAEGRDRAFT_46792 [Naegleria gruberi]EFC48218.1 predicted protein [Naegleria gruberi]|eukprot:XP_002680962.1 predicted protein [Naegleria gruberi strain NEG-M]